MASLRQIPQAGHPSPAASPESPRQGVQMILIVQQVVGIYTVLALTFGNHYFRDRRPRKNNNNNSSDSSICRTQEKKIKRQKEARAPGQLPLSCQSLKLRLSLPQLTPVFLLHSRSSCSGRWELLRGTASACVSCLPKHRCK